MKSLISAIALGFALFAIPGIASADVVSSSGEVVVSSSGAPVTQGGVLVESEHEARAEPAGRDSGKGHSCGN